MKQNTKKTYMYNKALKCGIAVLLVFVILAPIVDAKIQGSKVDFLSAFIGVQVLPRVGADGVGNSFDVVCKGNPASKYDLYVNFGNVDGITHPELSATQPPMDNAPAVVGPGHWWIYTNGAGTATVKFDTSASTTAPAEYKFSLSDPTGLVTKRNDATILIQGDTSAPPTFTATPTPTPSTGSLDIRSSPSGAMIFVDNAMKGITPLVVSDIPNGEHKITLQKAGYDDGTSTVTVLGDTELVDVTLVAIQEMQTPTPSPTQTVNYEETISEIQQDISQQEADIASVETKVSEINETVEAHATQIASIMSATTPTTPDYQATIAALQAKQAEQEAQIDILTATVNAIKALLGIS